MVIMDFPDYKINGKIFKVEYLCSVVFFRTLVFNRFEQAESISFGMILETLSFLSHLVPWIANAIIFIFDKCEKILRDIFQKILRNLQMTYFIKLKTILKIVTFGFDLLIFVHFNIHSIKENKRLDISSHRKCTKWRLK